MDISNESGKFACYVAPGSSTVINLEKEGWSFEVVDGSNGREFIGISEPAITGVFPNTIKKKSGKDVVQSVRITGVNLMENCKILTSNPGIVCEDIIFISSTEVAANFRIKSSCPELNIYLAFRNPDMQSEGFWIRVK